MKLLLAEDENGLAEALVDILSCHNYQVDAVQDGADALDYARTLQYDGILLDVMLPRRSGFEVLRQLRQEGSRTPVLLLTARSGVEDRIRGLDLGADDYLPKPFDMGELLARIRAMLRRREEYRPDILIFRDLSLNPFTAELGVGTRTRSLSGREYHLMEALMLHPGQYLSSEQLLTQAWGYEAEAEIGSVWVYISYLRSYLRTLGARTTIRSRRSIGYRLEEAP